MSAPLDGTRGTIKTFKLKVSICNVGAQTGDQIWRVDFFFLFDSRCF